MRLMPRSPAGMVALGAAAAVVGVVALRPLVVGVVRVGYGVKDYAGDAWGAVRREAHKIRAEATIRRARAEAQAQAAAIIAVKTIPPPVTPRTL